MIFVDVLEEAHRQHLVALVEHEHLSAVEGACRADVVEHAARRADDDVRARLERSICLPIGAPP